MPSLSNDFSRFVVINLEHDRPGRGPYVVAQTASDPEDPRFLPRDYVLTRQADWIEWLDVMSGPPELLDEVIHDEVREMLAVIDRLVGSPRIRRLERDPSMLARRLQEVQAAGGLSEAVRKFLREREQRRGG